MTSNQPVHVEEDKQEESENIEHEKANKWMEKLMKSAPHYANRAITQINIPGTHESLAVRSGTVTGNIGGGVFTKCQYLTLTEQLELGYRFFDLRLKYRHSGSTSKDTKKQWLQAYHGQVDQERNFRQITGDIKKFLAVNKNECIILKIKNEGGDKHDRFAETFLQVMDANPGYFQYYGVVPTLGGCAGQIVIMADPGKKEQSWVKSDHFKNKKQHNKAIKWPISFDDEKDTSKGHKSGVWGTSDRWTTFVDQIHKTIAAKFHDNKLSSLFRANLNSNGLSGHFLKKSSSYLFRHGTPHDYAKELNVPAARFLIDVAYTVESANKVECNGIYLGVPQFDFPKKNDIRQIPSELAQIIIHSNCVSSNNAQGPYAIADGTVVKFIGNLRTDLDTKKPFQNVKTPKYKVKQEKKKKKKDNEEEQKVDAWRDYDNAYNFDDSYEESEEDLYGFSGYIGTHKHKPNNKPFYAAQSRYIGTDYDYGYQSKPHGRSHHDTVSDGYYDNYGGYDHANNNDRGYLVIFAVSMMMFIGICCLMMIISVFCGLIAGKFYYKTRESKSRSKHAHNGNSYDEVDVVSEDQV